MYSSSVGRWKNYQEFIGLRRPRYQAPTSRILSGCTGPYLLYSGSGHSNSWPEIVVPRTET